jgi:hypothetical protein
MFSVTSFPYDMFIANRDPALSNLTIKNSQKHCLFHISDSPTAVSVNYSTEDGYDILYFENGDEETLLTGSGTFSSTSSFSTRLSWISDATTLSESFSVSFSSPKSTLPALHLNYTANSWPETSVLPEILYDRSALVSSPPTLNQYANADGDLYRWTGNKAVLDAVVVVSLCFAVIITIFVVYAGVRGYRRFCAPRDHSQMQMLQQSDIEINQNGNLEVVSPIFSEDSLVGVNLLTVEEDPELEIV